MLQNEEALKTGGPARSQQRVIFVSDTLCMTSASCFNSSRASHVQAGVIAVIGDIVEGPMRKKVVALWVSREGFVAPARHDGRLHIQDASHILEIETSDSNERFSSISALKCPTPPGDDSGAEHCDVDGGNDAAGGSITVVVIACSPCAIYRWTLQLDKSATPASKQLEVTVADVGRYLQRQRPWRNVPAPLVLHAVHVLQEAVQTQGYGTVCTIGDCNETENISAWSVAVVLSATIEGSAVIIRDNQLSVVCMISASSYASLPESFPSSPTSSPSRGKAVPGPVHGAPTHVIVTSVNSRAFCFISYENGSFSMWDVEPCVRISDADLADEELDLSSLMPILLFDTRFAYEISVFSVLQSVTMNRDTARASRSAGAGAKSGSASASVGGMVTVPVLVGSRDGRLRKLQLEWSNSSVDVSGNVNVKEVYNIDLAKETRYLEAAMQKNSISGQGALPNDTPAQVKHNFSCIPLALAPLPGSGSGTDAINAGICQAVTTRAILTLRLRDLKVLKSVALSSLGEMSGGVATKALSDAAVSSYASLFVSAFDKQVRVYYHAVSVDGTTTTTARGAGSRPLMKRPSADAALATASAAARTKAAAGDSMSANDTPVSTLSFFLTAADMSVINGPDAADGKDEAAVGFSLGREGGDGGTDKCIRISPLAAPNNVSPPTPMALRGAAAKGTSPSKNPNSWETPGKDKSGKILNQPVTFHARIKSSGYGQSPQGALEKMEKKRKDKNLALARERQKDTLSRSVTAPARNGGATAASAGASSAPRLRRYPTECAAITVHQAHNEFTAASMAGPLHRVTFNGDGSAFGVATSDSTVSVLKAPISRYGGDGTFYMSHNADITNVQFSHQRAGDKQLVLSSSADGTARVWRAGKVDYSAVCFTHDKSSTGSSHITTTNATSSRNRPYSGAIVDASFYYNDRFVSLANGNRAFIYTYSCDGTDAKNDLKRLQSNGSYRRAHEWSFSDAKSVTALANINSVLSPLLFSATSDRKLHVLDAARGAVVRSIEASHERAIHCIALPQPSVYAQLDASSYNVFATAAMDNCIVIWDIRSPSVAGRFTGHVNRREHVRCALSPCLRYLACGSEDKAARLVDLRTVTEVTRYTGHRDVVSDAAFHPISAQLATSSYDGSVKFYCSSDAN